MNQFVQLDTNILKNKELNSDEKITLSLLNDRMKSSVKRRSFYDDKKGAFYVIYPIEELMEAINVSKGTAVKILKKLEKLGYVAKRKIYSQATRLFLPQFQIKTSISSEIEPTEVQNLESNHRTNQTNYTDNTVNTVSVVKTAPVVDEVDQWVKTTHEVVKLTVPTLNAIKQFCNSNIEKCKYVVRLVLNARNKVARQNNLVKSELSQFESNKNLQNGLFEQLEHIFSYVKKHGFKQYAGYVTNALKDYFKDAMGLSKGVKLVKPAMQSVKFDNGKKRIHEELPDWAKDDYVYVPDKHVDLKKQAELKAMLAAI